MSNGSSTMKGYTPEVDATVVTRILDAGTPVFHSLKRLREIVTFSGEGSLSNSIMKTYLYNFDPLQPTFI